MDLSVMRTESLLNWQCGWKCDSEELNVLGGTMLKVSVLEAGLQLLSAVGKMCQGQWRSSYDICPPPALWKGVVRAEGKGRWDHFHERPCGTLGSNKRIQHPQQGWLQEWHFFLSCVLNNVLLTSGEASDICIFISYLTTSLNEVSCQF